MSYLISDESGTCAALPLRDSWGTPLTVNHWTVPPEPVVHLVPRLIEPRTYAGASMAPGFTRRVA